MKKTMLINPEIIPKHLIDIIKQIIDENKFPEWNINIDDASNTH